MKALKKTLAAVAATTLLSIGSVAHAGAIIDLFNDADDNNQQVTVSTVGGVVHNFKDVGAGVIGSWRDLSVEKTADNSGSQNVGDVSLVSGGGVLNFSTGAGVYGSGVVTWDGASLAGARGANVKYNGIGEGVGFDLTHNNSANGILALIGLADLGFYYEIKIWDINNNSSTLKAAVQDSFDGQGVSYIPADYLFEWFHLDAGLGYVRNSGTGNLLFDIERTGANVDFTKIGALQLHVYNQFVEGSTDERDNKSSIDLGIGAIRTVPEPGTLALVGAALFGVSAAGRRRKA